MLDGSTQTALHALVQEDTGNIMRHKGYLTKDELRLLCMHLHNTCTYICTHTRGHLQTNYLKDTTT
eukprot:1156355-Pelagomonas_calceolata.AAC.1